MRRRQFIALLGGAAAAWPLAARAQQSGKVYRIGFVGTISADSLPQRLEAFRAGLHELGYQEGRNVVIEYRWADGQYERLPALFAEIVRLNVNVIVTHGTPGALAAKQVTNTIPIVVAAVGDAEASGVVGSLARPGGNLTGLTFFNPELAAKQRDEVAASHSITSSARSRMDVGTSSPSALAVLRLTIVSNFVARSTGRSLGFTPFRILSTNVAARRNMSGKLIP